MIFKRAQFLEDWSTERWKGRLRLRIQPDLRVLAASAEHLLWGIAGKPPCVTNVFADAGRTGTHSDGRALDFRTRTSGRYVEGSLLVQPGEAPYLTDDEARRWVERINAMWDTGVTFPTGVEMKAAVQHDTGLGPHVHLQVAVGGRLRMREGIA